MRFVRSVAAVLIGFVFVLGVLHVLPLLTGEPTFAEREGFQLVTLAGAVGASIVAGYLTAWIAGTHEFPNAATVGLLLVASAFYSMKQQALGLPGWYEITIAGCGPMAAMVGCALRLLTKPRRK